MIVIAPDLEFLRPYAEELAAMLGIVRTVEIIRAGCCYAQPPNIIGLDPGEAVFTQMSLVRILAHEMRHVYQYEQGWLTTVRDASIFFLPVTIWRGEKYRDRVASLDDYFRLPWERDANEFSAMYIERFHPDLESFEMQRAVRAARLKDVELLPSGIADVAA